MGAALLALNPYQVWYSQEARMYTPVALFGLIAIYCTLRALQDGKLLYLGLYAAFMLLSLYSHYHAVFLFVFANLLWLAVRYRTKPRFSLTHWIGAPLVAAALFLPWWLTLTPSLFLICPFVRAL